MYEIEGITYQDRVISQSQLWLDGNPKHNYVDGECCIDFSCCNPELFTEDFNRRRTIHINILLRAIPKNTNWFKYVIVPVF